MSLWMIAGYVEGVSGPGTKALVGYRFRNRIVKAGERVTCYTSPSAAQRSIETAAKRWPAVQWVAEPWMIASRRDPHAARPPKQMFTRAEVWDLILKERAGCAGLCEDEEAVRTTAGQSHAEESESRGRCFAAARAAINCALGIRSERPTSLEALECEAPR